ncbi:MAG: PH domain-containing protein [Candidatus Woesearchaeota archaeon]|nr:MAG: PH domain-containing protein [Candidatus Woesearchaeota archaeon]
MERPIAILKPSITNAIVPIFIRNLVFLCALLFAAYAILQFFGLPIYTTWSIMEYQIHTAWLILISILVIAILPLTINILILYFTKYYFFRDRAISEFKFIVIKTHAVIYNRIADIKVKISLWDRLCKAGDVTLHTAENDVPDLTLKYIKNPRNVEQAVYNLINKLRR